MVRRMKTAVSISRSGQISIPVAVRKRWGTTRLVLDDQGDRLVLEPLPEDPIGAAIGSLAGPGPSSAELRSAFQRDELASEARHLRQPVG